MNRTPPVDLNLSLSAQMAETMYRRVAPQTLQWHYEHALLLMAMDKVGQVYDLPHLRERAMWFADRFVSKNGDILSYRMDEFNLDQVNPGKLIFTVFERSGDHRYRTALDNIRAQLGRQPRTRSGGYWHKKIYPDQMWLDGLYMAEPFFAHYAARFGTDADFDDISHQFTLVYEKTREARSGLLYHAWDESRTQLWSNPETGCSPNFWGRAMGWFLMAIVDTIDYFPVDHPGREVLSARLESLMDALLRFQDPKSGMWYQVVDQGNRNGNYLETSATAMFVYAMVKAGRKGFCSKPAWYESAGRAFAGLRNLMLESDADRMLDLKNTCSVAGLGGNPYRDGSFDYYISEPKAVNDYKGVGPFILAGLELEAAADASLRNILDRSDPL